MSRRRARDEDFAAIKNFEQLRRARASVEAELRVRRQMLRSHYAIVGGLCNLPLFRRIESVRRSLQSVRRWAGRIATLYRSWFSR